MQKSGYRVSPIVMFFLLLPCDAPVRDAPGIVAVVTVYGDDGVKSNDCRYALVWRKRGVSGEPGGRPAGDDGGGAEDEGGDSEVGSSSSSI